MTCDLARDTLTESVDGDLLFQKVLDKLWVFFSKYFVHLILFQRQDLPENTP